MTQILTDSPRLAMATHENWPWPQLRDWPTRARVYALAIQTRLANARAVLSTRESTRGRTLIFFPCTGFLKGKRRLTGRPNTEVRTWE